jgi:hypothetical protein
LAGLLYRSAMSVAYWMPKAPPPTIKIELALSIAACWAYQTRHQPSFSFSAGQDWQTPTHLEERDAVFLRPSHRGERWRQGATESLRRLVGQPSSIPFPWSSDRFSTHIDQVVPLEPPRSLLLGARAVCLQLGMFQLRRQAVDFLLVSLEVALVFEQVPIQFDVAVVQLGHGGADKDVPCLWRCERWRRGGCSGGGGGARCWCAEDILVRDKDFRGVTGDDRDSVEAYR